MEMMLSRVFVHNNVCIVKRNVPLSLSGVLFAVNLQFRHTMYLIEAGQVDLVIEMLKRKVKLKFTIIY